jgi:hypothetical protein
MTDTTHTWTFANQGVDELGLPQDLEGWLNTALELQQLATDTATDLDSVLNVKTEIEDAINAKIAEHGTDSDGMWNGEWSAAEIIRAILIATSL